MASVSSPPASGSSPTSSPDLSDEHVATIAGLLHGIEDSLDHAYGLAGELASALTAARRSAKLSAVVGQSAFDAVGQMLAQTGAARGRAVAAHRSLDALARRLGFDPSAYGDDRKDPDPGFFGASAADRDVAA